LDEAVVLSITPAHVEAVYECLRTFEPWRSLSLPEADALEIHINRRRDAFGHVDHDGVSHRIHVSQAMCKDFDSLVQTVGHEMLHLVDWSHGRRFRSLAKRACSRMGWDLDCFL
jgi:hypothetical protein